MRPRGEEAAVDKSSSGRSARFATYSSQRGPDTGKSPRSVEVAAHENAIRNDQEMKPPALFTIASVAAMQYLTPLILLTVLPSRMFTILSSIPISVAISQTPDLVSNLRTFLLASLLSFGSHYHLSTHPSAQKLVYSQACVSTGFSPHHSRIIASYILAQLPTRISSTSIRRTCLRMQPTWPWASNMTHSSRRPL